jgi:hypothetical protein
VPFGIGIVRHWLDSFSSSSCNLTAWARYAQQLSKSLLQWTLYKLSGLRWVSSDFTGSYFPLVPTSLSSSDYCMTPPRGIVLHVGISSGKIRRESLCTYEIIGEMPWAKLSWQYLIIDVLVFDLLNHSIIHCRRPEMRRRIQCEFRYSDTHGVQGQIPLFE